MRRRLDDYTEMFPRNSENARILKILTNSLKEQAYIFYNQAIGDYKFSDMLMPPNELLIHEVTLNAMVDLIRVKKFHLVDRPTRYKYAAYVSYWWLRLRPFSYKVHTEEEAGRIAEEIVQTVPYAVMTSANEIFLCDYMLSMIGRFIENVPCSGYDKVSDSYEDLRGSLLYFMQYRLYTEKHLELFLKALNVCPMAHQNEKEYSGDS